MSNACYVCGRAEWKQRVGRLRDAPTVGVIECRSCGLVVPAEASLVAVDYAAGTMHGVEPMDIIEWRAACSADDLRRTEEVRTLLRAGESVLDVGCGSGGFLHELKRGGVSVFGIELEKSACEHLKSEGLHVWSDIADMPKEMRLEVRVVTMFHVLEHLRDPRTLLRELILALPRARLFVIEVPCSEDPLLALYHCEAFGHFTYWSHHEHLHSKLSLELLLADFFGGGVEVSRRQRFGLGNHLGWLSRGQPGGQAELPWLEGTTVDMEYRRGVLDQGFGDTLWAVLAGPQSRTRG